MFAPVASFTNPTALELLSLASATSHNVSMPRVQTAGRSRAHACELEREPARHTKCVQARACGAYRRWRTA